MRIGYRSLLAATLTLTALISWGALSAHQTVQAESVDTLARASACTTSAYHVMAGANATISVENDGGWCWADIYERSYWQTLSARHTTLTNPPKHGQVLVSDTGNQAVRIAYRPNPGFAGTDSFIVHYNVNDRDQSYLVTVSRQDAVPAPKISQFAAPSDVWQRR
jgi:hypothetical protein